MNYFKLFWWISFIKRYFT